jgi:hypothetical protein
VSQPTPDSRSSKRAIHATFTHAPKIVTQFSTALTLTGATIMANSSHFRMTLTPEQKDQVRKATGKDAEVIELSVEELEERIAPALPRPKL